ncbi:MAG: adenylate/guanylate cyclase domain-containing protein, partial [Deltaproteobacteria bacterium]|nr:adenylate/guanylate cyclase domain-containing protein [Deltaproteobacteria bacterium]
HSSFQSRRDPVEILEQLQTTIISETLIFMGVGIWLVYLVSSNMTRPLQETVRVLQQIRNGQFENKVRVTSNDEIGYTGDVINEMTEGLKERDFIKEVFGKYVSKEIRDEILSGKVTLDGELRQVTVLFADLRNFTPLVETTPPKEVVKVINSYFKEMDEAINHHHGLVIQYIGDEIEAVFGAPIYRNDHPVLAVRAALEMKERLRGVNRELNRRGYPALFHGIGIHTGEVLAANIGSPERLSYALVGDTVNLASRVQGLNKEFGTEILITTATRAALNGDFSLRELPATPVKGKSGLVELYAVE